MTNTAVYSFLYCRLLTRMSHCWLALLMGIFHWHPFRANQLNQVLWLRLLPLASAFTSSLRKQQAFSCRVCVAREILRVNVSPAQSLCKPHLKLRGMQPLISRLLSFCSGHPQLKSNLNTFVSAPPLQLLCMLAPQALCAHDPTDLMFPPFPL